MFRELHEFHQVAGKMKRAIPQNLINQFHSHKNSELMEDKTMEMHF